jgi:tripartite-type tricarboxylate transporter receptor subunit TctC
MTAVRTTGWHRLVAAAALLLAIAVAPPASAQDYPTQTVKIVVPFVAGGGVDVVARIIAPKLGEELGQSVIIENRGGAGGMLGAAAVAQSPPDGTTFLLGTGSTHGTNSSVYAKVNYDPVRDFAPVVLVSTAPLLVVRPTPLAKNAARFALAQQRASPSASPRQHQSSRRQLFNSMARIQTNHVPYRARHRP